MVGRQFQRGKISQFVFPISELPFEHLTLEPAALPRGVVGILDWQRGEMRRLSAHEGAIEARELPPENAHRPAVGDNMMDAEQQQVLLLSEAKQLHPQQWTTFKIERLAKVAVDHLSRARLPFGMWQRSKIGDW